jgi:hypothetical protein
MAILDGLKQLLGGASSAIANLKRAEHGMRQQLDEFAREQGALFTAPLAPADVTKNLKGLIADLGQRWTASHGMDVVHGASGGLDRSSSGPAQIVAPHLVLPDTVTVDMMAALCPDALLDGLQHVVQGAVYQPGPPLAKRIERLGEIERERETLLERHANLVDEAAAAGVILEHLGEETAARFQKAQRREAWERDGRANETYYRKNPSARPPEPA